MCPTTDVCTTSIAAKSYFCIFIFLQLSHQVAHSHQIEPGNRDIKWFKERPEREREREGGERWLSPLLLHEYTSRGQDKESKDRKEGIERKWIAWVSMLEGGRGAEIPSKCSLLPFYHTDFHFSALSESLPISHPLSLFHFHHISLWFNLYGLCFIVCDRDRETWINCLSLHSKWQGMNVRKTFREREREWKRKRKRRG